MLQGRMMMKEIYTRMVLLEASCCLLLLALSCFHVKAADPLQCHDAQRVLDRVAATAEVNSVANCSRKPPEKELKEAKSTHTACFVSVVGRGAGKPLSTCPLGKEQSGLLCYPPCRNNYHSAGPVCLEKCSSGFTDGGVMCIHSYGKGCCCTVFGCCGCPAGYKDDGCFCRQSYIKKSYGRGVGVPLGCGPGKEKDGMLCYEPCSHGYRGEGAVCWQNGSTSAGFPIKCNDFVWAVDRRTCRKVRAEFSTARVASVSCLGVALAATAIPALEPLMVAVCSTSIGAATAAADKLIQMTGARSCPKSTF